MKLYATTTPDQLAIQNIGEIWLYDIPLDGAGFLFTGTEVTEYDIPDDIAWAKGNMMRQCIPVFATQIETHVIKPMGSRPIGDWPTVIRNNIAAEIDAAKAIRDHDKIGRLSDKIKFLDDKWQRYCNPS